MKILALGAHADDVEIGCGGSLSRWSAEGHDIAIHVATTSGYATPDGIPVRTDTVARAEAESAAALLGAALTIGRFPVFGLANEPALNDDIVSVFERLRPDLCLVHWHGDTHPDHRALFLAAQHASRRCRRLLGYASNWYLGAGNFDPRYFVDISTTLKHKRDLISRFKSENGRTNSVWLDEANDRAAIFGRMNGVAAAEGFEVYKFVE